MERLILLLLVGLAASSLGNQPVYTQVVYLYDIKRGDLANYKRTFQYYLQFFDQLMTSDSNLIIFGNQELEERVWKQRYPHNTVFVQKQMDSFKNYWFDYQVQKIRKQKRLDPAFQLIDHPQYALEYYNLLMFAKLYIMVEALSYDKFNTDIIIWSDGGYMHQFPKNILYPYNLVKNFYQFGQPQWTFIRYEDKGMFRGYSKGAQKYLNHNLTTDFVILASCFGGYTQVLIDMKQTFENFLRIVLEEGDMNSDESVLSLMVYRYPYLIPSTFDLYLLNLYKQIRIRQNVNKKPEYNRFFEPYFDDESNMIVKGKHSTIKYIVSYEDQVDQSEDEKVKMLFDAIREKGKINYAEILILKCVFFFLILVFYLLVLYLKKSIFFQESSSNELAMQ